jgi:hypothetical protein
MTMNEATINELCKAGMTRGNAIDKLRKDSIGALHKHPAIFADLVTAAMAYMRFYAKHGDGFGDVAYTTYEHCCALLGSALSSAEVYRMPAPSIPKDVEELLVAWADQ